jgi:hypothetical protein
MFGLYPHSDATYSGVRFPPIADISGVSHSAQQGSL